MFETIAACIVYAGVVYIAVQHRQRVVGALRIGRKKFNHWRRTR